MSRPKKRKPDLAKLPVADQFDLVEKAIKDGVSMARGLCDGRVDKELRLSSQHRAITCYLSDHRDMVESLAFDLGHTRSMPMSIVKGARSWFPAGVGCMEKMITVDGMHFFCILSHDYRGVRVNLDWIIEGEYDPYD